MIDEEVIYEGIRRSPDPILMMDSIGEVVYTNTAWEKFAEDTKIASPETVPGLNYVDVWGEESNVRETLSNVLSTPGQSFEIKHGPLNDDRWFQLQGTSFEAGGEQYVLIHHTEITDLKHTLRQTKETAERYEAIVRLLAHDLQNPLTVSIGYKEMLEEKYDDDRFETINHHLDRMVEILNDGLQLAREGSIQETESIDLQEVAERCWGRLDTKQATLFIDDSASFQADPSLLDHLFENLFKNSIRHAGETVTVGVGTLEDGFYIEDDGPGIPAEKREEVLEPGYSDHPGGTGLGLPIVKTITDSHGWELQLEDAERGGIRFEIRGVKVER